MDSWVQDEIGGQWRNTRTGEVANALPSNRDSSGRYNNYGYGDTVHIRDNGNGTATEHNNEYGYGQTSEQWWHG